MGEPGELRPYHRPLTQRDWLQSAAGLAARMLVSVTNCAAHRWSWGGGRGILILPKQDLEHLDEGIHCA